MKKRVLHLVMIVAMSIALAACGGNGNNAPGNETGNGTENGSGIGDGGTGGELPGGELPDGDADGEEPGLGGGENGSDAGEQPGGAEEEPAEEGTSRYVINELVEKSQREAFIEADAQMLKDMYRLDADLFEDYTVLMPAFNISTMEFAVFKVKDAGDIPAVEDGIRQRAEDVQKAFEEYLPDQYENAKNYKTAVKGNFVLFVISQDPEATVTKFEEIVQ